ncbi:MAG: SBBP repeat-containing protein [Bacteroidota bacterium]
MKSSTFFRNTFLFFVFVGWAALQGFAQPGFTWAKQLGGSSEEACTSVATDDRGHVYAAGYFTGVADLDPGPGSYVFTSVNACDAYIAKLDTGGNLVWARQLGNNRSPDVANSVAVDKTGNVYITGRFSDTADMDPGPGVFNLVAAGCWDIFVLRLDAFGNLIWARQMGGSLWDEGNAITVDPAGNIYIAGSFLSTVDFDPGSGIVNLTSAGSEDAFICKLSASGSLVWAAQLGGSSGEQANSLALDAAGNVYSCGFFRGIADFDPGNGIYTLSAAGGASDIFISKLDGAGNFSWARQIGGASCEEARAIAVDGPGNVYTTGSFYGTVDFDPGAGSYLLNATSTAWHAAAFVSKLDASGSFVWARKFGDAEMASGHGIGVDHSGNVYTTGKFFGTTDFDPGTGSFYLSPTGNNGTESAYISRLDAAGNFNWAQALGSVSAGLTLALDNWSTVYTAGYFMHNVDFDPGSGIYMLSAAGSLDAYVHKVSQAQYLSADEHAPGRSFFIGPNPSSGEITIRGVVLPMHIEVYSASGERAGVYRSDEDIYRLTLPRGIWLLRIYGRDGASRTEKVVMQ